MTNDVTSPDSSNRFRVHVTGIDHPALQVAIPLVSVNDHEVRCIGTACAIAPGLAITSAHVVADWLSHQERRDGYRRQDAQVSVIAIQFFEGRTFNWTVEASYRSSAADIAFLQFHRPAWWGEGTGQVRPVNARLNFNPPNAGDEVRVFGFPGSKVVDGILQITPCESLASVRDVHMKGDGAFRPLAYVDIDGEILPGMSGGPCFDRDWNVLGINAKGWEFQDDSQPLSYVALIWPAMSIDIDLFKTGSFPAMELFNQGPARALGYQRLFVASSREVHLSKENIGELKRIPVHGTREQLLGALNFAASNAQRALAEIRILSDQAMTLGAPLDANAILNGLRQYFWELDAALTISVTVARRRLGVGAPTEAGWNDLVGAWRSREARPTVLDELGLLNLVWEGKDLFELRTFAWLCRSGVLRVQSAIKEDGQVVALAIGPCIERGQQAFLPDGLTRFYDSCQEFVQRLLTLEHNCELMQPDR